MGNAGSKGSRIHSSTMIATIGQLEVDGKRMP